jgi:hypothetical protein
VTPFPCAVYCRTQDSQSNEFVFSHFCHNSATKNYPRSLRVRDIQEYHDTASARGTGPSRSMLKTHFIVLVSGDVAQAVCVENAAGTRPRFLYHGSRYCMKVPRKTNCIYADLSSEVSSTHVAMRFYSSLALFNSVRLASVVDIECTMLLFPKVVRIDMLPLLAEWVQRAIHKSLHTSTWMTSDRKCSYSEHTLHLATQKSSQDIR